MNDVFVERMVKKRMDGKDIGIVVGIVLAAMVLIWVSWMILFPLTGLPMIPFLVLIGCMFGGYKLITMRNLEFEYSNTNGYMTIDKIINRSTRKRMMAFECSDIEEMGKYPENVARLRGKPVDTKLTASAYSDGRDSWYIIARGKKTGKTLLVFDPDEDMLEAIKKFMPSHLRFEIFGRNK